MQVRSADHRTKKGRARLQNLALEAGAGRATRRAATRLRCLRRSLRTGRVATPESWTRAADKLHEAVTHFETADDDAARAQAAYALANVQYAARDEWAAAVRATEIATDAYKAVDDELGVQNAATLRAAAEIDLAAAMKAGTQRAEQNALYGSADRRLADAAEYFTSRGQPVRAQYAVNMRAVRAVNIGDYAAADKLLAEAVAMARANRDVAKSEGTRKPGRRAQLPRLRGPGSAGIRSAAAVDDRDARPYQYATVLGNFGFTLMALGDFDRALSLHIEALEIYTQLGSEYERAIELSALGGLYFRMGDAERALGTLRAAIVAQERVSDTLGLASTLRVAANAASVLGQHAVALAYLRRSAEIDANPQIVARTSVLIATELRALGDWRRPKNELIAPLKSPNALVRANALEERGRLRLAQQGDVSHRRPGRRGPASTQCSDWN